MWKYCLERKKEGGMKIVSVCISVTYTSLAPGCASLLYLTTEISFLHFKLLKLSTAEITKIGPTLIG